jgi:hypothetical protein
MSSVITVLVIFTRLRFDPIGVHVGFVAKKFILEEDLAQTYLAFPYKTLVAQIKEAREAILLTSLLKRIR